jgi:hypothetical protein
LVFFLQDSQFCFLTKALPSARDRLTFITDFALFFLSRMTQYD